MSIGGFVQSLFGKNIPALLSLTGTLQEPTFASWLGPLTHLSQVSSSQMYMSLLSLHQLGRDVSPQMFFHKLAALIKPGKGNLQERQQLGPRQY